MENRCKMSYFDSMKEPLETRISKRIARKRSDVFLRADFSDLGGYDQVGRVLGNSFARVSC